MKTGMAVLAAMVFGLAGDIQAQALGIRGGVNFASLSGDDAEVLDAGTKTGVSAGVFLNLNPSGFWSIQPEVNFSQMGTEFAFGGEQVDLKINYIQIPLLARVNFAGRSGGIRPHFLIGPSVSFKIGCDYEDEEDSVECDSDLISAIGIPDVKSTDFGAVFGAGLGIPAGRGELTLDGRLYQGLTNIFDSEDDDDDGDLKNEVWQILAGFSFPFGMR